MSNDAIYAVSNDTIHQASTNTIHTAVTNTIQLVSNDTIHPTLNDTIHLVSNDTTCDKTEKVKVLILSIDENKVLRDKEGRVRNSAKQLIYTKRDVVPNAINFAERDDFELKLIYITLMIKCPFHGFPNK